MKDQYFLLSNKKVIVCRGFNMNKDLFFAIEQIERAKGISRETLKQAIEAALLSAYKKNFKGPHKAVEVILDPNTGEVKVYTHKLVNPENGETLDIDEYEVLSNQSPNRVGPGEIVQVEITPKDFGRIAAQTAKQVIMQRIREAERSLIYDEFLERAEDIVTGVINRKEGKNIIIDLEKIESLLPPNEQIPSENYRIGARMKFYIIEVKKTSRGPRIVLSRSHPGLVKRLFELEVPEVHDGFVTIKAIAREPGARTKIAVESRDAKVDPVGSCIGNKGARVKHITDELRGEKIDIIRWSNDPKVFISDALSPAHVTLVELDSDSNTARVYVPDDQLSLAIGKEGQNARLSARLTGWRIDIKSDQEIKEVPSH
jgi:N utilization substance protein A